MDIEIRLVIVTVVLASAVVLTILALRQAKRQGGNAWRRFLPPIAVLIDCGFLIAVWALPLTSKFGKHHNLTRFADVFLVASFVLLIGVVAVSASKWKLPLAMLMLLSLWVWTEQHSALRDEGSMLSLAISRIGDKIGCPPGNYSFDVLHKMLVYAKRGHDDAAINAGKAWTASHPDDWLTERIHLEITWLLLKKAQRCQNDPACADEYVTQALQYRDKALQSDGKWGHYSLTTLSSLAALTEFAGDLSTKERCAQYRNATRLLERRTAMLNAKQDQISRRFVPDKNDFTIEQVKCLSDETQTAMAKVRAKQQQHGCTR